jgi:hypothetical protein
MDHDRGAAGGMFRFPQVLTSCMMEVPSGLSNERAADFAVRCCSAFVEVPE